MTDPSMERWHHFIPPQITNTVAGEAPPKTLAACFDVTGSAVSKSTKL
jgi:hypothetical protein